MFISYNMWNVLAAAFEDMGLAGTTWITVKY